MSSTASTEVPQAENLPGSYQVIRRNGKVTPFDSSKIKLALTNAFIDVDGHAAASSNRTRNLIDTLTDQVSIGVTRSLAGGGAVHIEDIQDYVELALMRAGEHKVARSYVLYREARARERAAERSEEKDGAEAENLVLTVKMRNGETVPLDGERLREVIEQACSGIDDVSAERVLSDTYRNLYDGISESDLAQAPVLATRQHIETEPNYNYVASRLLMDKIRHEALTVLNAGRPDYATTGEMDDRYPQYFADFIAAGIKFERLDPRLADYDLDRLGHAIDVSRDESFTYLALQTLYDRYLIHEKEHRFELPQAMFMRIAMGLALAETDREAKAIEFYEILTSFDFMSSTPTLFNSGTLRPQLSSCYLTSVPDNLHGIYEAVQDNALLSKFAGGLGNDWTPVRAMGSRIKGTNGKSQGVVPFLKVVNDTAIAVNQCFGPSTTVYTAAGATSIKDVRAGDLVLGKRGSYRQVLKHIPYNQTDPMVSLKTRYSMGETEVTAGHPFWALTGISPDEPIEDAEGALQAGAAQEDWVEAGRFAVGDYLGLVVPQEVVPARNVTVEIAREIGRSLGDAMVSSRQCAGFQRGALWSPDVASGVSVESARVIIQNASTSINIAPSDVWCDLTDEAKRLHPDLSHLPADQTWALVTAWIAAAGEPAADGDGVLVNVGTHELAETLRYQCLRLKLPTGGEADIDGSWTLRIPAQPWIAEAADAPLDVDRDWIVADDMIYVPITAVREIDPVPFVYDLQVEGDPSYMTSIGLAHNGGKRKGAVCAYLETWHRDIEEFLDLRKNTGDDRRRCHDMNTANWIPDLFMKRVFEDGQWTLFSPNDVPDLHDLYGSKFEAAYEAYEALAAEGKIPNTKTVSAVGLWRSMLSMVFETGHPWLTFKDPCNLRSPQQHQGVVHSSNLCTEITLNTIPGKEIAVCNLGSINLPQHIVDGKLDEAKLARTISTAMRMLDNVIEYNYYSVRTARDANLRHRPVGLGLMGFQDALYKLKIPYESEEAVAFSDRSMEMVSYYAIQASTDLAEEKGAYSSFKGSLWDQGILPIDSIRLLREARDPEHLDMDMSSTLDWDELRDRVRSVGMRNSNCMAIAPTATIANITGVSQSIEPTYQNLFVKSNLSGEFTVVNQYLVDELKALDIWDKAMANDLKHYDGSVQAIERVPDDLKVRFKCAFEMDPHWLIESASRRQKWLDQAQSLNLYMSQASGRKIDILYREAWRKGLKTTYYLRTFGATHVEKSTIEDRRLNAV